MIDNILAGDTQQAKFGTAVYRKTVYDYRVYMMNPEGNTFIFRNSGIMELQINDNIDNYYQDGYMVVTNDFDLLERPSPITGSPGVADSLNTSAKNYVFRGDSRDSLKILITPRINTTNNLQMPEQLKEAFSLEYDFIIYNVEEITTDQPSVKYKKLYFWDTYHQILSEKNISFSTAKLPKKAFRNFSGVGEVSTGAAIQELIKAVFPTSDGFNLRFGEFDAGGTDIFFSSPANFKADDCLQYLLSKHVSTAANNYDKCILSIDRYPKQWTLTSLKASFDAAYDETRNVGGSLFLERYLLGGFKDSNANALNAVISRSPALAPYFGDSGTLDTFSLVPSPGHLTQAKVNSRVVHSYSPADKAFYIDSESNSFVNTQDTYEANYVQNMLGQQGNPSSNLIGNIYRTTNQNITNV